MTGPVRFRLHIGSGPSAGPDRWRRTGVPPMPADYQPTRSPLSRLLQPTLRDSDRRLFWLREHGYRGPIDQDGWPTLRG